MNKINKIIWEIGLNLVYIGTKITQKAFSSLKHPHGLSADELKVKLRSLGFDKKNMISCSDRKYQIINWKTWRQIIKKDLANKLKYYSDYFDCDNFALLFSSLSATFYRLNSCATVYGRVYDKNYNFRGYHAFNTIITDEKIYCYEPQTDGFCEIEVNKPIIIGGWIYQPHWFFFF